MTYLGPPIEPVGSDAKLPVQADVVVIGGGIIGTCTALYLARKGVSVVLCEKGEIAGEQSSRNWGWVRKTGRDSREMPLIIEALRLWGELDALVEADTGFRRSGILFAGDDAATVARYEAWLDMAKDYQLDTRLVTGGELEGLLPGATRQFAAALWTASDGRAEPQLAAPAVARAARRLGADVFTHCAVRGLETAAGKVAGVVTEKGRIACDAVVLAGGAWSRLFCGRHALDLPQLKIRASVYRTGPIEGPAEHAVWTPKVAFRKRRDGGYTIANGHSNIAELVPDSFRLFRAFLPAMLLERKSLRIRLNERFMTEWRTPTDWPLDAPSPFEAMRILDPKPVEAINTEARASLETLFPAFKGARIAQQWAGQIDVTPDAVPVISGVDALPGFFVATGFSGHGFGIGPGAGRLMADLVTGDQGLVDPTPFRFGRFSDGSNPRPEAGL